MGEKGEKIGEVVLSDEQREVLRMVVEEGRSVFFTGSAGMSFSIYHFRCLCRMTDCLCALLSVVGTGKSLLLRAIIIALRKKYAKKAGAVSVTASTGMAASNVGGTLSTHPYTLRTM